MTDGTPLREQLAALIDEWVDEHGVVELGYYEDTRALAERLASAFTLIGRCTEGGGGYCTVFVDRDLDSYPVGETLYRFNASQ